MLTKKLAFNLARFSALTFAILLVPFLLLVSIEKKFTEETQKILLIAMSQYGFLITISILIGYLYFSKTEKADNLTKYTRFLIIISMILMVFTFFIDLIGIEWSDKWLNILTIFDSITMIIFFGLLMTFLSKHKIIKLLVIFGISSAIISVINLQGYTISNSLQPIIRIFLSLFFLLMLCAEIVLTILVNIWHYRFFTKLVKNKHLR
ncbi:hypothetical protein HYW20_03315 [Candidatus Woesearchaeota archaeon]|nr:hypothetical protein [Candidatus Woesearchaeota archaeon]